MKYLMTAIFGLMVLAVLFIAVKLGPAHVQIRTVEVEFPSLEEIANLSVDGVDKPQTVSFVTTAQQKSEMGTAGHVGVLVAFTSGKTLLIDTGMDRAAATEFGELIESMIGADPIATFGALDEQLGSAVNDIQGIVFTHLHSDHTQGVTALCAAMKAPARIFQTLEQAKEHNFLTKAGQVLVDDSSCQSLLLADDTIKPVDDFPGVYMIAAGGHTPGSTIIVVVTDQQTWIFSGDLTNSMASIRDNEGKGWLYSNFFVPEDTAVLEKWRLWLRAADELTYVSVLPAHDIDHMREKLQEPMKAHAL